MVHRNVLRAAVAASAVALVLSPFLHSGSAQASDLQKVSDNGFIRVTSMPSPAMENMQVGVPADWQLAVQPLVPGSGHLDIGFALTSAPALAAGLTVEVLSCITPWVAGKCSSGEVPLFAQAPVSSAFSILDLEGVAHQVGTIRVTDPVATTWLTLRVTPTSSASSSASADFLLAIAGSGVPVIVRPDALAYSGFAFPIGISVLMLGACLGGLWLFLFARHRRPVHAGVRSDNPESDDHFSIGGP